MLHRNFFRNSIWITFTWLFTQLFSVAAHAQQVSPATYMGIDREQYLIDGAKKEGNQLMLYTSMSMVDDKLLIAAFEKKYGIKVNIWRGNKSQLLQRLISESRVKRYSVDFVANPQTEMEALHNEGLLQPVKSPVQANLIPAAIPGHHEWTGMRVYLFVMSYNTDKLKPADLPRTYQDLLDPKWKGKLGLEDKQQEWFYTLIQAMGKQKGMQFFRDLIAKQNVFLCDGNTLLNNRVISGEIPLSINAYSYLPEQARANTGAPVAIEGLGPVVADIGAIAIPRHAPHPYAAALFYDFMLTDGQKIVAQGKALTTNVHDASAQALLTKYTPVYVNPDKVLKNYAAWGRLYQNTINGVATNSID